MVVMSFRPVGRNSGGMDRSISSWVGLLTPIAASLSASSLQRSTLWPLTHLKWVGAFLLLRWQAAASIHAALWVLAQPVSSQECSEWFRALIAYCESVIMVRSAVIDLLISKINQESVPFIIFSRDKYPDDSLCRQGSKVLAQEHCMRILFH